MEQVIVPKQNEKTKLLHSQPDAYRAYAAHWSVAEFVGWQA